MCAICLEPSLLQNMVSQASGTTHGLGLEGLFKNMKFEVIPGQTDLAVLGWGLGVCIFNNLPMCFMPLDNFEIHGFHLVTPNWTEQKNYLRLLKIQILGQYPAMILMHKEALPQYFSF